MKKQFIIITSIFSPTKAVEEFSKKENFKLVVIGDKKTPERWKADNTFFISVEDQNQLSFQINDLLPFNHYSRKNIGYIHAIKNGAEVIIDTDDDNIPYDNWSFPDFEGNYPEVKDRNDYVNIYSYYAEQKIWPRGLPLDLINSSSVNIVSKELVNQDSKIGVWQGLADGEPDVDAIYRLVDNTPCAFQKNGNIVLPKNTISPFNSQNTAFRKELFPLLYIPTTVTMRFSDILRGLVAQPIMWFYGYKLGITEATVYQERNEHDFVKDFIEEIPCYIKGKEVIDIVKKAIKQEHTVSQNLYFAYEALYKNEIVKHEELLVLKAWINDIN